MVPNHEERFDAFLTTLLEKKCPEDSRRFYCCSPLTYVLDKIRNAMPVLYELQLGYLDKLNILAYRSRMPGQECEKDLQTQTVSLFAEQDFPLRWPHLYSHHNKYVQPHRR